MKGISKLLATFLQIMEIGFIIIAILASYFTLTTFNLDLELAGGKRTMLLIGEAALSAPCLTEKAVDSYPIKALFNETKLSAESASTTNNKNPSCLNFPKSFLLKIYNTTDWILIGNRTILLDVNSVNSTFPAAIKLKDTISPTIMHVYIG